MQYLIVPFDSTDGGMLVDRDIACMSEMIHKMATDCDLDNASDPKTLPIPLPNVSAATFTRVIDWCQRHARDQWVQPDEDCKNTTFEPEDEAFFSMNIPDFMAIWKAADYLDIPHLNYHCIQKLSNLIKAMDTVEEISAFLGIKQDLTPEQRAEIRNRWKWALEYKTK